MRKMTWATMLTGDSAAVGVAQAGEALKVGFVYVSPIGDAGWTFQHDLGRKALEKALGDKVVTKYVENVPQGADAGARDPRAGRRGGAADLHDLFRLYEPHDQGGDPVSERNLHARHRVQIGQECGDLQRPLL